MWQRWRYRLYAPLYDRLVGRFAAARQASIEEAGIQLGQHVLLVGAGTGLDLPYLPAGISITATDVNPWMLRYLRPRAAAHPSPVAIVVMDGRQLALPSVTFDTVILHLVLAVMPEPERGIHEAVRVLKRDGRLVIFDKFLPPDERPTPLRRVASGVMGALATDLNRRVEPLLASVPVQVTDDRVALRLGSVTYRILYATKA